MALRDMYVPINVVNPYQMTADVIAGEEARRNQTTSRLADIYLNQQARKRVEETNKALVDAYSGASSPDMQTRAFAQKFMETNPSEAINILQDLDTREARTAIEQQKMEQAPKDRYDADSVRFKLVSRKNAISGQLQGMSANEPMYETLDKELKRIDAELKKDNPSVQSVYASEGMPTDLDLTTQPSGVSAPTYDSILSEIGEATKETFDSISAKVATDKGAAKLSNEQTKFVDSALEKKRKELFPVSISEDQRASSLWDKMSAEEQKSYSVPAKLYSAGVDNYRNGLYGTAIQNFIKTANPGEAVMADDVNMANKGQVSSGMLALLRKIGYDATNDNVQEIALQLSKTASNAIGRQIATLDTYDVVKNNPAVKDLFIKRYMVGVKPADLSAIGRGGQTPSKPIGLRHGTIINGYRFKGGDRKDPKNWEAVK